MRGPSPLGLKCALKYYVLVPTGARGSQHTGVVHTDSDSDTDSGSDSGSDCDAGAGGYDGASRRALPRRSRRRRALGAADVAILEARATSFQRLCADFSHRGKSVHHDEMRVDMRGFTRRRTVPRARDRGVEEASGSASVASRPRQQSVVPPPPDVALRGPSRAKSALCSLRRALLMPQVNTGSLYRCDKRT